MRKKKSRKVSPPLESVTGFVLSKLYRAYPLQLVEHFLLLSHLSFTDCKPFTYTTLINNNLPIRLVLPPQHGFQQQLGDPVLPLFPLLAGESALFGVWVGERCFWQRGSLSYLYLFCHLGVTDVLPQDLG